jgi:hypothetical protein
VKVCDSEPEIEMASFVNRCFFGKDFGENEATSSAYLFDLTAMFLRFLNENAPPENKLPNFRGLLDSVEVVSESALSSVEVLKRPDCQVYVRGALLLRWENKFEAGEVGLAANENASKLKEWSTLYYGKLPYVIGGRCGGGSFRWLKLSPNGKVIRHEGISGFYDLNTAKGIVDLLHSVIRMHRLLQKL